MICCVRIDLFHVISPSLPFPIEPHDSHSLACGSCRLSSSVRSLPDHSNLGTWLEVLLWLSLISVSLFPSGLCCLHELAATCWGSAVVDVVAC